jgi:O-antigen biosynthesis protein
MLKQNLLPIKTPVKIGFLAFLGDQGGCGILRTIIPYLLLPHLRIPDVIVHSTCMTQYVNDLNFYRNFSFVQFQRSATERHLQMHRNFRTSIQTRHKIPLIYEIDDLLTYIPEWNFAHIYYKDNLNFVETMMRESDAIVVSTPVLKKIYSKYNRNIKVMPNHLAKFIWGDIVPKHNIYKDGDKVRICWAGSQNHFKHPSMKSAPEGGDFGNELMEFIRKTVNDYQWVLMGAMPTELDDMKDKIEFHEWKNTWEYPQYLKNLNIDMAIAPLLNNVFNSSKSNIKALEYTACGVPGVYSRIAPYNNMSITCETGDYMIDRIELLARDVNMRKSIWEKDYETVKGQLWWEENDNMRRYVDTYLSLMNRKLPD